MKHGFIKVAAATPRVTVADCKANGEEILKAIHEMEKEHVKLMVFPEFCITGYTCHDLFLQRCLLDSAWDELLHIADETKETIKSPSKDDDDIIATTLRYLRK